MSERKILDLAKPILKTWPSESHLEAMILQQEKGNITENEGDPGRDENTGGFTAQ